MGRARAGFRRPGLVRLAPSANCVVRLVRGRPRTAGALALIGASATPHVAQLSTTGSLPVDAFTMVQPAAYLTVAPLARVLDELTLLDDRQHVALLVAWLALAVTLGIRAACRARRKGLFAAARAGGRVAGQHALLMLGLYLVGGLLPRPMIALVPRDPDVLLVDFHSHTERSHDGRWGFTVEHNRRWHEGGGFHAAYITDHQTMEGWQALATRGQLARSSHDIQEATFFPGASSLPPVGTTLLPGIESVVPGAHLNLLGVRREHAGLFSHRRNLDTVQHANMEASDQPLALLTLPFDLGRAATRPPRLHAIELTSAAPKGLRFARQHRARIVALADSLGVALVSASNHHGWGSTVASWTALRLPGWRALDALELDRSIRASLQARPRDVTVVERRRLEGWSQAHVAATAPRFLWHVLRSATPAERLAAMGWILLLSRVVTLRRRSAS